MQESMVNSKYSFDERNWVISHLNTAQNNDWTTCGHAKIIVEGMQPAAVAGGEATPFVGVYHIGTAVEPSELNGSVQGAATSLGVPFPIINLHGELRLHISEPDYDTQRRERQTYYRSLPSESWMVNRADAIRMITAIQAEKTAADASVARGGPTPDYQFYGKQTFFRNNGGHSCITWTEEKLAIAGVGKGAIWQDHIKAKPSKHIEPRKPIEPPTCVLL